MSPARVSFGKSGVGVESSSRAGSRQLSRAGTIAGSATCAAVIGFCIVYGTGQPHIFPMKILTRLVLLVVLACSFTACLLKEPVFTEGFAKADSTLGGVWAGDGDESDPRKLELALCAPLDDTRYVIHYPAMDKDGIYYEARPVVIRDRTVLQLRALATLNDGIPKADAERYTLIWIEKVDGGKKLRVRALTEAAVKNKTVAEFRKTLETESTDWGKLFGEPANFHRLKDR